MVQDRSRIQANIQHSLPHLQSPHAIDQRNSESPMSNMYAPRHVYQTPSPAHQTIPRENLRVLFTDDRQQHSNSPSYPPPTFDSRGPPQDRDRGLSPYAVRDNVMPRTLYSPPLAHGRYSVPPQGSGDTPGGDRQSIIQTQTPPHANPPPSQGDSLLMLLQVFSEIFFFFTFSSTWLMFAIVFFL